ncbi:uncharacterized protein LOC133183454 [Saccostrea echinata]|uniref:uncharacterized protein LOC133183454 n=1 Tax=Saccostrea echinata TaxID=191078 RepID=UPI002A81FC6A|nr:uncharacterized protein LOC133183454 [Saccostrea echinata]
MVGEDCCGTNAYSIVKQFCCNKTGKYTVINKTSSLNKSLNGESKCPGYRFAIKCGKTQLNGKKEPCCNSRVSKNDHLNGQTVCSQLEENTSRNQTMTERRKTRNRVRHGICRICSLNTNSLLSLIKKQKVSVCRKKVILLAVDTSNRIGRYWMLNVTASYPNSTREGSAEFNLKVLLPCTKCSKLQSKVTNYLLLTQSRVVPGKLLRLGDSDFLFPNKTTKTDTYLRITNQQAKCKDNRNVFVNALKKRMRKGLKKFLKELFQFKLR